MNFGISQSISTHITVIYQYLRLDVALRHDNVVSQGWIGRDKGVRCREVKYSASIKKDHTFEERKIPVVMRQPHRFNNMTNAVQAADQARSLQTRAQNSNRVITCLDVIVLWINQVSILMLIACYKEESEHLKHDF